MAQPQQQAPAPGMNLDDVLFILFRHKWKILFCAALGVGVAVFTLLRHQPVYQSDAKLLVRYVVDRSAVDTLDSQPKTPGAYGGESITNSELEILTSWDLAEQVAEAIGPERLVPNARGGPTKEAAAYDILSGFNAGVPKGSNVILVSYANPDPKLAVRVLEEIVSRYFVKHLEVHRSADAFNFVSQQSDQVRARLNQTEEELKRLKGQLGITSLAESSAAINSSLGRTRGELQSTEAALAEQRARIAQMEKSTGDNATQPDSKQQPVVNPNQPGAGEIQQYQALVVRLEKLRDSEMEMLAKYGQEDAAPAVSANQTGLPGTVPRARIRSIDSETGLAYSGGDRTLAQDLARERYKQQNDSGFGYRTGKKDFDTLVKEAEQDILVQKSTKAQQDKASKNVAVKLNRMEIENLEKQRLDLETKYPGIAAMSHAASAPGMLAATQNRQLDLSTERVAIAGTEARTTALQARLADLQKQAAQLSEIGPQIAQLERTKEIEEGNYKYFQASLERARIDEALDPSKMPNISVVQKPTPAVRVTSGLKKTLLGLAGGGLMAGVALAFLIEMVLDRTVKRPLELSTRMRIPMLLWIPYLTQKRRLPLPWRRGESSTALRLGNGRSIVPWDVAHFIRPFAESIRDRLTLYFEVKNLVRKPKLVAVTGCSKKAGTSTLAGGLAAALSETGEGKVLLVDMNVGRAEVHPFFRGSHACSLTEAIVGAPAPAGDNLYLAVASPEDSPQAQLVPKRFHDLVPHLKASDFDYIIFDMPPLAQTSMTLALAGFMDKILLVAEANKSNRDVLRRTYLELAGVNANVSAVLNKTRFYTPKWLHGEY